MLENQQEPFFLATSLLVRERSLEDQQDKKRRKRCEKHGGCRMGFIKGVFDFRCQTFHGQERFEEANVRLPLVEFYVYLAVIDELYESNIDS